MHSRSCTFHLMHIKLFGGWGSTSHCTSMPETENDKNCWLETFLRDIHSVLPAVKTWFGLHYTAICKNYCGINNVNREFTSCNIASVSFRLYYLWLYYLWLHRKHGGQFRYVSIWVRIAMVSIPWPPVGCYHGNKLLRITTLYITG